MRTVNLAATRLTPDQLLEMLRDIVKKSRTLREMNLTGVDLSYADLSDEKLWDANLTGAIIFLYSTMAVIGVLISDLLLVVVDPRIKLTGSARSG